MHCLSVHWMELDNHAVMLDSAIYTNNDNDIK